MICVCFVHLLLLYSLLHCTMFPLFRSLSFSLFPHSITTQILRDDGSVAVNIIITETNVFIVSGVRNSYAHLFFMSHAHIILFQFFSRSRSHSPVLFLFIFCSSKMNEKNANYSRYDSNVLALFLFLFCFCVLMMITTFRCS